MQTPVLFVLYEIRAMQNSLYLYSTLFMIRILFILSLDNQHFSMSRRD